MSRRRGRLQRTAARDDLNLGPAEPIRSAGATAFDRAAIAAVSEQQPTSQPPRVRLREVGDPNPAARPARTPGRLSRDTIVHPIHREPLTLGVKPQAAGLF